jgi:hypothetical protein
MHGQVPPVGADESDLNVVEAGQVTQFVSKL